MQNQDPITLLVHQLARLPGVGRKSAARLAYFILQHNGDYAERLASAIQEAYDNVQSCETCGNLTMQSPCTICVDTRRDPHTVCVVEQVPDLLAVESTASFRGRYHVLKGAISPLNGVGPDNLRIRELIHRVENEPISEIIVATNSTVDGEATALYIRKVISDPEVRVSRIASGIPAGGDIEYLDRETISRALAGRRELS